jgi:hypothetical protein
MGRRLRDARIGSRGGYSLEDDSDDDRHDGEVDDNQVIKDMAAQID